MGRKIPLVLWCIGEGEWEEYSPLWCIWEIRKLFPHSRESQIFRIRPPKSGRLISNLHTTTFLRCVRRPLAMILAMSFATPLAAQIENRVAGGAAEFGIELQLSKTSGGRLPSKVRFPPSPSPSPCAETLSPTHLYPTSSEWNS